MALQTEVLKRKLFAFFRDVHYENFRAQCISQIAQQGLRQERGKLKRDSISSQNDASITETDRLLLQKDEEVRFESKSFNPFNTEHFQIRRMQDMLTQMQEKLKTTHLTDLKKETIIDV